MSIQTGEKDLWLIRVERKVRPPQLLGMTAAQVVLTVCSGQEAAKQYIAEERSSGPCRIWIAALGDIGEHRFVEQTL